MTSNSRYIIRAGRVIVGNGEVLGPETLIEVTDKRISSIGGPSEVPIQADARVIDAPHLTVMPGMMDLHLHLTQSNCLTFHNYRAATFELTSQARLLYALLHAQMCVEMGFTTLRDTGARGYMGHMTAELVALRDAIAAGIHAGPRIMVSGFAIITGSHIDLGIARGFPRPDGYTADGPWELRKLARTHLRTGADWIKTALSGGGGTDAEEPDVRNMTQEEIDAVVDEAHAFHKRVACHCFTAVSQKMALRAGVDTLEHSVFTDDEAISLMLDRDITLVPTLAHRTDHAIEIRQAMGTSDFTIAKMKSIQPYAFETFQRIHAAGVRIACGTDTQIDPEMGSQAAELGVYVKLGMSPADAIATATINAAHALGLASDLGTLEVGKLADIIGIRGNPLQDIETLQQRDNIELVMKEGEVYVDKRDGRNERVIHDADWGWRVPL